MERIQFIYIWSVLVFTILLSGIVASQDALTLDHARLLALEHSTILSSYNLSVDSSLLAEKAQRYEMVPSLSVSSSVSLLEKNSAGVNLGVSQLIWDGGRNSVLLKIDRIETSISRQEARSAYFSVLDAIDSAYYSVLESEATLDAAKSSLKAAEENRTLAENRLEIGTINKTDYLEVESEVESKKSEVSQANRDFSVNSRKLISLTGLTSVPILTKIDFTSYDSLISRLSIFSEENIDVFISRVRNAVTLSNPTLLASSLATNKQEATVHLSKKEYMPTISASYSEGVVYSLSKGDTTVSGNLSLTGSIPLDVWKTKTSVDSSLIAKKKSLLQLEEQIRTIDLDVQSAVLDCIAHARSVVSSQKAYEYAQRYYESKAEMYALSSASLSDLSDANALMSANLNKCITARYGFMNCLSTLRSLGAFESDASLLALIP